MNITQKLFNNTAAMGACDALTTGLKYNFKDLTDNIREYSTIFSEYKNKGVNSVAVIVGEQIKFDTISLILALMHCDIAPIIIDEKIGEQVNGILAKEEIDIVFYDSMLCPKYLQKYDIVINDNPYDKYYVTLNPNINVKNKMKMTSFTKFLKCFNLKKESNFLAKVYGKDFNNVIEDEITEENLDNYDLNYDQIQYKGRWQVGQTSLPLHNKTGLIYLMTSLSNSMHMICQNKYDMEKNMLKILKEKPSIITVDKYMLLEFAINEKLKNMDLSFVKKVVLDVESQYVVLAFQMLEESGFKGEFMRKTPEEVVEKLMVY